MICDITECHFNINGQCDDSDINAVVEFGCCRSDRIAFQFDDLELEEHISRSHENDDWCL